MKKGLTRNAIIADIHDFYKKRVQLNYFANQTVMKIKTHCVIQLVVCKNNFGYFYPKCF